MFNNKGSKPMENHTAMRKQRTVEEEERLLKLFTQWANFLLERRGLQIETVGLDISDGLILIQLAEILTNVPVAKHHECPTLLIQNIENLTIALEHFSTHGNVDTSYISPSSLAQNDVKQILGMFWVFALKFKMNDLKKRWEELRPNGAKRNQFLQLKREMRMIITEDGDAARPPKKASDDQVKNLLKQQALAKYISAVEALKQWSETMADELQEGNRALDAEPMPAPAPGPAAIVMADNMRRARENFRDVEKAINDVKLKRKSIAEDAYIEMKKAGCSDPPSCPFTDVEECTNKLEGVLFERRRKLDERLRKAEEEAEREREMARQREAANTRQAQIAQLEAERERQEEDKKRMEAELRERARLLKQELLKLKGDGITNAESSVGSGVVGGGTMTASALVRSESGGLKRGDSSASKRGDPAGDKTPDPRRVLNAECSTGSMGSFLLRRHTRREEEGAPCTACKKMLGHTLMLLVDGKDLFHSTCFVCTMCGKEFDDYYYEHRGEAPLCFEHYAEVSGLSCHGCGELIRTSTVTLAMGKKWHSHCFTCTSCRTTLKDGHYVHEGQPYCQLDFYRAKGLLCVRCETPVGAGDKSFEGRAWHKTCWTCTTCNRPFGKDGFYGFNGFPFCGTHYEEMELRVATQPKPAGGKFGSWSRRTPSALSSSGGAEGMPLSSRGSYGGTGSEWDREEEERLRRQREQLSREKEESLIRADMDRRKREALEREKALYLTELERKKREIERDLDLQQWGRSTDRDRDRDRDLSLSAREPRGFDSRDRDRDRDRERYRESSVGRDRGDRDRERERDYHRESSVGRDSSSRARAYTRDGGSDSRDLRERERERDRDRDIRDRDRERSRDRDSRSEIKAKNEKELRRASVNYTSSSSSSSSSGRRPHY